VVPVIVLVVYDELVDERVVVKVMVLVKVVVEYDVLVDELVVV
jgi:hypothetical protein